jgi:hypothetical protein
VNIDDSFDCWRRALDASEHGDTYMRGLLVMFERTWLDRP